MNSEELEMSLRSEFEGHLKSVLADMRQDFSELQKKVEAEFDKQKEQLNAVFQEFSTRLETGKELDRGFTETVVEHLRLARDEGARITATAITEAEAMSDGPVAASYMPPPSTGVSQLRDAINDITSQTSQGTILTALVEHAAQFTPRGAFFIIKNEHFVGWRVFGKEADGTKEDAVRDIHLPVSSSTVLGESVRSLSATESSYGTHDDDANYLDKLEFGQPDRMLAIPLVARGRGVAVLYADYGQGGEAVNVEALEALVRVAGLTVEVLASAQAAKSAPETQSAPVTEVEAAKSLQADEQTVAPSVDSTDSAVSAQTKETAEETIALSEKDIQVEADADSTAPVQNDYQFQIPSTAPTETVSAEKTFETFGTEAGKMDGFVSEPIKTSETASAAPPKSRLSDRNVDLPIEVGEDERRLHNDARRFARLLVSEIKLYNEQKVKEGREAQDLYDRLREAIDRSRDMYDKRVQPPVASKFDYFHYELVSTLAEGEEKKLGGDYPGAVVR